MREKTNKKSNFIRNIFFSVGIILLVAGLLLNNPYYFLFSTIFVILSNVIFSIQYFKDNFIFLIFNGTFTFFLVSRFIVAGIFGADYEYNGLFEMSFSDGVTTNIILLINISIVSLTLAYYYFYYKERNKKLDTSIFLVLFFRLVEWIKEKLNFDKFKEKFRNKKKDKKENRLKVLLKENKDQIIVYIRWISLAIYIVSIAIQIFNSYKDIELINEIGYRESYLLDKTDLSSMDRILDIIGRMHFTSFIVYLATLPKMLPSFIFSLFFLIPGILELSSGGRTEFVLNFLIVLIYFVFRIKNEKLLKKIAIGGIVLFPIIIIVLMFVEASRGTQDVGLTYEYSFIDRILKFFYGQGVSARAIGNAQEFIDIIPYRLYSFGEIIDFIKYTVLGNIIPGIIEPQGQSYEVVMGKSQLSHMLTFLQSPYDYLNKGLGTGSSYIAELYVDFRIIGVIFGSMFYGYMLNGLRNLFYNESVTIRVLMLMITRNLLLAPRASFTYFLDRILQVTQIGTFFLIFVLAIVLWWIIRKRKRE